MERTTSSLECHRSLDASTEGRAARVSTENSPARALSRTCPHQARRSTEQELSYPLCSRPAKQTQSFHGSGGIHVAQSSPPAVRSWCRENSSSGSKAHNGTHQHQNCLCSGLGATHQVITEISHHDTLCTHIASKARRQGRRRNTWEQSIKAQVRRIKGATVVTTDTNLPVQCPTLCISQEWVLGAACRAQSHA